MKKYKPLLKFLTGVNLVMFCMLTFFIYFDVKTPGMHGLTLEKTVWTPTALLALFFLTHSSISIYSLLSAINSTKSISDLKSRFLKNTKFKLIDKEKIISFLTQNQYTVQDGFYSKSLGTWGGNKSPTVIKIILSTDEIELQLDRWSLINFQMDKKYCEEVNAFRTACKDAIGNEAF